MYEEGNRHLSLNWGSLIIKIVILAVIIFLAGWIFTRVTKNNNKPKSLAANTEYITNITAMKEAAFEYFTKSTLPEKVGGTEKLTLSQMLNQKLLIDFTEDGKTCDINESYVQATKTADGNYALKVSLTCGDKSDFIITSIDAKENSSNTTSTDVVVEPTKNQTSSSSSSSYSSSSTNKKSSSSSSSSSKKYSSSSSSNTSKKVTSITRPVTTTVTTSVRVTLSCGVNCTSASNHVKPVPNKKTRYYKYVKWSDWTEGCTTANNAEVKKVTLTTYNYCKYNQKTYYSTSYVSDGNKASGSYGYELQFLDINPLDVVNSKIEIVNSTKSYFGSNADYQAYVNSREKELYMTGNTGKGNSEISSIESFRNSSLKRSNFRFGLSNIYYSGDIYRAKVTINYYNKNGVTPYHSTRLNRNIYYVPLKFDVRYADANQCTRDLDTNSYKYNNHLAVDKRTKSACMYRVPEYKWSTEKSLNGYEYTGEYQDR